MKTFRYIIGIFLFISVFSCQQLDEPTLSSDNTMTSFVCTVTITEKMNAVGSKPEDETQLFQGSIADNGIITFTGLNELTDEQKKRAKFSAIIPLTAKIVEKDGVGNIIGNGVGGVRTISKKTYYFYVVAANGTEKKYVTSFN